MSVTDPIAAPDEAKDCGCSAATCSCGTDCACCAQGGCASHAPDDCSVA